MRPSEYLTRHSPLAQILNLRGAEKDWHIKTAADALKSIEAHRAAHGASEPSCGGAGNECNEDRPPMPKRQAGHAPLRE